MSDREKILLWRVLVYLLWEVVRRPGQKPEDNPLIAEMQVEIRELRQSVEA